MIRTVCAITVLIIFSACVAGPRRHAPPDHVKKHRPAPERVIIIDRDK